MSTFKTTTMVVPSGGNLPLSTTNSAEREPREGRQPNRISLRQRCSADTVTTPTVSGFVDLLLHGDEDGDIDEPMCEVKDIDPAVEPRPFTLAKTGTPSIPIAMTPAASRSKSRQRNGGDTDVQMADHTPRVAHLTGRARRRKKKAVKKAAEPALHTIRGFTPTPLASGDEDSDFSQTAFKRKDLTAPCGSSIASSPYLRPSSASGGISALRQQLDALDLEPTPGQPSVIRNKSKLGCETPSSTSMTSDTGSDRDPTEMTSYEVALEHDFVSRDAEQDEGILSPDTPMEDSIHRKMTAADFDTITCLGKGTFGTVHLVKQAATGRLFAQKQFRKASLTVQKRLVEQTKTERAILESINRHPFVVKLYYAFQDREKLYLILEYAQGGELFTHLATERMFPEATAAFYMAEMVLALDHLHQTVGVLYRDLKPENCLLDAEGHLLLTDFGLSKVAVDGHTRSNSFCGTVEYMAPEVILGHHYGHAVDWWSFGVLGFDLLTGSSPFCGPNHAKTQEKILKQKLALPYFLSPDAKDLLTRLLRKEPSKRLGATMPKDLLTIKKHRFFRHVDWGKLERRECEPPIRPVVTDPELAENFSSEFTALACSPVIAREGWGAGGLGESGLGVGEGMGGLEEMGLGEEGNPFGGFSFVASKSMLDEGWWEGGGVGEGEEGEGEGEG